MENRVVLVIFAFIAVILILNTFKFIADFFSNRREYKEINTIRGEVNQKVKPYLGSLEKKFQNDETAEGKFGHYVYGLFKDQFPGKDKEIVEREVCRCCSQYEGAECKEDFCLEGSGISCNKKS